MEKNPDCVTRFYNEGRKRIMETEPNEAHKIIVELEHYVDLHICTQNIDDLHERVGSQNAFHLNRNNRYAKNSHPDFQEKKYYPVIG